MVQKSKHIELLGTVTLGPKGQVVIPAEARKRMGVSAGDKMVALYMSEKCAIGFISEDRIQSLVDKMGEHVSDLRSALHDQNNK